MNRAHWIFHHSSAERRLLRFAGAEGEQEVRSPKNELAGDIKDEDLYITERVSEHNLRHSRLMNRMQDQINRSPENRQQWAALKAEYTDKTSKVDLSNWAAMNAVERDKAVRQLHQYMNEFENRAHIGLNSQALNSRMFDLRSTLEQKVVEANLLKDPTLAQEWQELRSKIVGEYNAAFNKQQSSQEWLSNLNALLTKYEGEVKAKSDKLLVRELDSRAMNVRRKLEEKSTNGNKEQLKEQLTGLEREHDNAHLEKLDDAVRDVNGKIAALNSEQMQLLNRDQLTDEKKRELDTRRAELEAQKEQFEQDSRQFGDIVKVEEMRRRAEAVAVLEQKITRQEQQSGPMTEQMQDELRGLKAELQDQRDLQIRDAKWEISQIRERIKNAPRTDFNENLRKTIEEPRIATLEKQIQFLEHLRTHGLVSTSPEASQFLTGQVIADNIASAQQQMAEQTKNVREQAVESMATDLLKLVSKNGEYVRITTTFSNQPFDAMCRSDGSTIYVVDQNGAYQWKSGAKQWEQLAGPAAKNEALRAANALNQQMERQQYADANFQGGVERDIFMRLPEDQNWYAVQGVRGAPRGYRFSRDGMQLMRAAMGKASIEVYSNGKWETLPDRQRVQRLYNVLPQDGKSVDGKDVPGGRTGVLYRREVAKDGAMVYAKDGGEVYKLNLSGDGQWVSLSPDQRGVVTKLFDDLSPTALAGNLILTAAATVDAAKQSAIMAVDGKMQRVEAVGNAAASGIANLSSGLKALGIGLFGTSARKQTRKP